MRTRTLLSLSLLLVVLAGCGSGQPLRVTSVQLGRSLNADGTVAGHTSVFAPGDTIYISVLTAGNGSGTIGVRWVFMGRVIGEPKKQVAYKDVAATEFHLQSTAGFPPGDYKAEVTFNDQPVETRSFKVEKPL